MVRRPPGAEARALLWPDPPGQPAQRAAAATWPGKVSVLISRHVTQRIRTQHREVERALRRLEQWAALTGHVEFMAEAHMLSGELRDHFALVDAVLDAVSEDDLVLDDKN